MARDERCGVLHEGAERAAVFLQRDVEAHVNAAVTKVTKGLTGDAVSLHQRIEVTQVRPELLRRNRRVLPAGPTLFAILGAACESRAVCADRPQFRRFHSVRHHSVHRRASVGRERRHRLFRLGGRSPTHFDKEPATALGQLRHCLRALCAAHSLDEPRVEALHSLRLVSEHRHDSVGRGRHIGIREHRREADRRHVNKGDLRFKHRDKSAFGAHEELREVCAVFWQQVFEAVAAHLTAEATKLGADESEVRLDELGQARHHGEVAACGGEASAETVNHVELNDVVARLAKGHRVGAACVVADEPTKGGAR